MVTMMNRDEREITIFHGIVTLNHNFDDFSYSSIKLKQHYYYHKKQRRSYSHIIITGNGIDAWRMLGGNNE